MNARTQYPSNLSELQWFNIEELFPPERRRTGRKRKYPIREFVNAIFYLARAGFSWRMLPHDLPPWGLVSNYFYTWREAGIRSANPLLDRRVTLGKPNLSRSDRWPGSSVIRSGSNRGGV